MMHDDIDWSLLARYFSGVCSPAEVRTVEHWIEARPERRREIELLRSAWDEAAAIPLEPRAQNAFPRVAARVGLGVTLAAERTIARRPAPRFAPVMQHPPRRRSVVVATRIAAAILVVASAWTGWERLDRSRAANGASPARAARVLATRPAQRASIELADGTRVTLGPASRLRIPERFGDRTRTVTLDGDAYFVVEHDAQRPFRVRTANTITEDLGTAFVIHAHARDSVVEVIVVEGRVALRPGTSDSFGGARGVALTRGQLGRVEPSGLVSVTDGVDVVAALAWTHGQITFDKTPLRDVRRALERWYDVRIELPDTALENVPVSASFDHQSADQALGTLARLLDLRYSRHGAVVRLLPRDAR